MPSYLDCVSTGTHRHMFLYCFVKYKVRMWSLCQRPSFVRPAVRNQARQNIRLAQRCRPQIVARSADDTTASTSNQEELPEELRGRWGQGGGRPGLCGAAHLARPDVGPHAVTVNALALVPMFTDLAISEDGFLIDTKTGKVSRERFARAFQHLQGASSLPRRLSS